MTKLDVDAMADSVVQAMKIALTPVYKRLKAAEQDIAALKAAPHLKYCGTWQSGTTYQQGDATTFSGSLWVCKASHTASGPVADHQFWQLAVKRGKGDR
jgi:predicted metal-binding transcription factor (methanogenesis marker protein 9)